MERDFKGVWIPADIWNKNDIRLSIAEKCYLGMINSGFSEREADYWMQKSGYSSTSNIKAELYLKNLYIPDSKKIDSPEKAKDFTLKHSHLGNKCEWCGCECYTLHEHHYPISRKAGGTKTVQICPNCHATYHSVFRED